MPITSLDPGRIHDCKKAAANELIGSTRTLARNVNTAATRQTCSEAAKANHAGTAPFSLEATRSDAKNRSDALAACECLSGDRSPRRR